MFIGHIVTNILHHVKYFILIGINLFLLPLKYMISSSNQKRPRANGRISTFSVIDRDQTQPQACQIVKTLIPSPMTIRICHKQKDMWVIR